MKNCFLTLISLLFVLPAFGQLRVAQTATGAVAGYPVTASFASAPATGDLLVAMIGYYTSDTVTPPTGWTVLQQQYGNTAGGTTGFTSFYHFVAPGESNSYAFGQGNAATLALYDIVGADAYHPFNGGLSNAQRTTAASVTTPAVTPTVLGTLPLAAIADEGSQPAGNSTTGWIYTAPTSTRHPVAAAFGPLTTDTTTPVASQFSLSGADPYGLAAFTVLVNPTGTTGHTPTASPGGPYSGVTSFAISFDGSASTDPRYQSLTYAWAFGDGSTSTGARPNHIYTTPGTYTVSLTVTDTDGNIANASIPATIGADCSTVALGDFGAMNKFVPSPTDAWHQDVSGAPVDPMSNTILVTNRNDLAGSYLHPDFGGRGTYGIPYTVVDSSTTALVPLNIVAYADESDVTLYPIPANMPVEGSPVDCSLTGDNHAIVFDKKTCTVHEMYHTQTCSSSATRWSADAGTIWDLTQNEKRPYGMTSVDAAGLSVFEGLIRYDEIVAGTINHAIRFTAQHTKNNGNNGYFTGPATHAAGDYGNGIDNIEGMRIRLKANFDISNLTPQAKIIAIAMKKYGMILADNGSNMFFQGTPDLRWDDDDIGNLKGIPASAFEVVNQSLAANYAPGAAPLYPNGPIYDAVYHPTGDAPVITTFAASSETITAGQSVTLTSSVQGGSYSYIDNAGFTRGSVTVAPAATTTYTLTSRNAFGTTTASTTVTVQTAIIPFLSLAPVQSKTYGDAPFTVLVNSNSTGAITYAIASGPASVTGKTVTLTGVGTVVLQASQAAAGNYAATTAQLTFLVNPATPALAFVPVANQTYGVAPFTVSSTSNSQGGSNYAVVSGPAALSDNVVTLTGVGTVVLQVTQAAAGNYATATATTSFTVAAEVSQLSFATIPTQTYGAAPFAVSATSASSGPVGYAVVSGPATVSGNLVTLTGAGTVVLAANQAAAGNYAAASTTTSFSVAPKVPQLAFTAIATQTYGAAPFTVSATSASSGVVSYAVVSGPATVSNNLVTVTGAGTVTLQARQAANGNYGEAAATASFTVAPAVPQLAFTAIATQTYGAAPFTVSATSASSGAVSYTVVSGPATVFGNLVTLTGTGTVTLQANQAAAGNYAGAAATVSFTVIASPSAAVTLTIANTTTTYLTPVSFNVQVASSQGVYPTGPITILDGAATVVGIYPMKATARGMVQGVVSGLSVGVHTLTALYAGDGNHPAGRSQTIVMVVTSKPIVVCPACVTPRMK